MWNAPSHKVQCQCVGYGSYFSYLLWVLCHDGTGTDCQQDVGAVIDGDGVGYAVNEGCLLPDIAQQQGDCLRQPGHQDFAGGDSCHQRGGCDPV